MTIQEAMKARHTVRRYLDRPLSAEATELLCARIAQNNREHGLCMALATQSDDGLGALAKLLGRGVNNYIVLAGDDAPGLDEKLGYCGADLILYAQTLGLNTWWIGGMFHARGALRHLEARDAHVNGVIAVGYGSTQGAPHKSRPASEISSYQGEAPQWFLDGVEALLLAPTALNRQAYTVRGEGRRVSLACDSGRFAGVDLGIGRYHFELGAGRENFDWA